MTTAADNLRGLQAGQVALTPAPLDLSETEQLEFWVQSVREDNGIVQLEARYHGVLMQKLAGKPNEDGSVTWTVL